MVEAGRTLRRRVVVIVASMFAGGADELGATVSAATAHAGGGVHVIVVADGFQLCANSRQILVDAARPRQGNTLSLIENDEFEGWSSALNRALALVPARSCVIVISAGSHLLARLSTNQSDALLPSTGDRDLFMSYARLAFSYGCEGDFVVSVPLSDSSQPHPVTVPIVIFDRETFVARGEFDERFQFQGSVAAWLHLAREDGRSVHAPELGGFVSSAPPGPRPSGSVAERWQAPPAHEIDRLAQLDADLFFMDVLSSSFTLAPAADPRDPMAEERAMNALAFHSQWMKRTLTSLSLQRHQRKGAGVRVVAVLCLYDDVRFIVALLEELLPRIHHLLVLHSVSPWRGPERPAGLQAAAEILSAFVQDHRHGAKVSVVRGFWTSEEEQRNFGQRIVAEMPGGATHVLVVDGDEFWHPVELDRALALVEQRLETTPEPVGWVRATMATYWKSIRTVVTPPEPLKILWLVSVPRAGAPNCFFSRAREWACSGDSVGAEDIERLGILLDASVGVCHHLSYVRTTSELVDVKFASFAHSTDVQRDWVADVWARWDDNHSMHDLHPTDPPAFARVKPQPLWALPPALRKLHLQNCKSSRKDRSGGEVELDNESRELICLLPKSPARDMVDPGEREDCANITTTRPPEDAASAAAETAAALMASSERATEPPPLEWQSVLEIDALGQPTAIGRNAEVSSRRYLSVVSANSADAGSIELTPERDLAPTGQTGAPCVPRFMILTVAEGAHDQSTAGVFSEISSLLYQALLEQGADVVERTCVDLRFCRMSHNKSNRKRHVILLGVHHLSRYTDDNGVPAVISAGWPSRESTTLYNFEHVGSPSATVKPDESDFATSRMWQVLRHYSPQVWDYSWANVEALRARNVTASHVSLGWHESLVWNTDVPAQLTATDIDVLFFGKLNSYREGRLASLRAAGVRVLHANALGRPIFGKELEMLVRRAKIVLSLRYFDHDTEWKMTRWLGPIANGVLVVSERGGHPDEQAFWEGGVIFAEPAELMLTVKTYLMDTQARQKAATRARELLQSRPEAGLLAPHVAAAAARQCSEEGAP